MRKAVVLPGLDGTGALLGDFTRALGRDFDVQVIAYPPDTPLDYHQLCEWVKARLPQDDFVLVAESFSGPIALQLARENPAGLKALVLSASFARVDLPGRAWWSRAARRLPLSRLPLPVLSYLLWGRWRNRERVQMLASALSKVAPEVLRARALEALSVDATDGDAILSRPMLYLRASSDRLIRWPATKLLARIAPAMQVQCFDAPHFLLQVQPDACANAIAAFARGVHSGS